MQGQFPLGWAEWNDSFRDAFRRSQNKLGSDAVTPGELAMRFTGSADRFQPNGRKPWHSVNFLVSHDGLCLRDLYQYTVAGQNGWDQGGYVTLQRQAARNGFAFPLLAAGVPMFTGGDEMYRTQKGNPNPFNKDNNDYYLDWNNLTTFKGHHTFARRVIAFRRAHPGLRPAEYFKGQDRNGNGLKDITWYRDDGQEAGSAYMADQTRHFIAYRIDATESKEKDPSHSVYVAYNGWSQPITVTLPAPSPGLAWHRAGDTAAWMESESNFKEFGQEDRLKERTYKMTGRSVLVLIER